MDILKEYWDILWRYKKLLAILIIIPTIIALLINIFSPNIYKSSTNFIVADQSQMASSGMSLLKSFIPGQEGGAINLYQVVMGVLNSSTMTNGVVKEFNLKKYYKFKNDYKVANKLKDDTEISLDEETGVISLSFCSEDPKLCRDIVLYYLNSLNTINEKRKLTTIRDLIKVIDPPGIPKRKTYPKRAKNMIIAFMLISILSVCSILFYYYFYPRILSSTNIERKVGRRIKIKFNNDYIIQISRFIDNMLMNEKSNLVYITSPFKLNGKSLFTELIIKIIKNNKNVCIITSNDMLKMYSKQYSNLNIFDLEDVNNKVSRKLIEDFKKKFKLILIDGIDFNSSYSSKWEYFADDIVFIMRYKYNYYDQYFTYIKSLESEMISSNKVSIAYYFSENDI
jgi:capsular polysaccharide biosynthesis protein